ASDITSTVSSVGSSIGITAESIGIKLADIVKDKAPETAEQAKQYCTQASTDKACVGIADDGMRAKAIDICAQKSSEGLEGKVNEVKDTVVSKAAEVVSETKETAAEEESSFFGSIKSLFGN
ncbi:MAG: hypothetical protein WA945_04825, partial [Arcobacteraceae bacterium]